VVAPNDLCYEVEAKVREYPGAGVPLVWVTSPETRFVQIFPADGAWQRVDEGDILTAPGLLPELAFPVGDLLGLPHPQAPELPRVSALRGREFSRGRIGRAPVEQSGKRNGP
jgi:hypothetical protein